jgi:predicted lipoprotein with Yx(FWY)xxD motif
MMRLTTPRVAALAATAALGLALSACGGSDEPATATSGGTAPTVSLAQVDGVGDVLVDARGQALYFSDQEAGGEVRCKATCLTFWAPLEATRSAPTAGSDVSGKLAVIRRPDGARQVTYDGKPLYRFTEDPAPGKVTGDGFEDSFGGTAFTWHAVTATGISSNRAQGGNGY